jgi:hypothetical protein
MRRCGPVRSCRVKSRCPVRCSTAKKRPARPQRSSCPGCDLIPLCPTRPADSRHAATPWSGQTGYRDFCLQPFPAPPAHKAGYCIAGLIVISNASDIALLTIGLKRINNYPYLLDFIDILKYIINFIDHIFFQR